MIDLATHKLVRNAIKQGEKNRVASVLCADRERFKWVVEPFGSWLHLAAAHGQLQIVEWLIHEGLDVNQKSGVFESGAIKEAASSGHVAVVACLLAHGAILEINEPTSNPLFGAIYGGHTEVAKLLIDYGVDVTVKYTGKNMTNMDALAFAREWGRNDIVELLEAKLKSLRRTRT